MDFRPMRWFGVRTASDDVPLSPGPVGVKDGTEGPAEHTAGRGWGGWGWEGVRTQGRVVIFLEGNTWEPFPKHF